MQKSRSKPGEIRKPLVAKVHDDLRVKLERSARDNGRTLSNEVERRLEDSFKSRGPIAGIPEHHQVFLSCIARVLAEAEAFSGQSFATKEGDRARTMARRGVTELVKVFMGEDRGESDGFVSGRRQDGTETIPNFEFSRGMAYTALRNEKLLVPREDGLLVLTVGPGSFE